jgi:transcriptional regulator with XRE-family HTH domain
MKNERRPSQFSRTLRQLREERVMTREELARASGLSLSTIRAYERGLRKPGMISLGKLIEGLQLEEGEGAVLQRAMVRFVVGEPRLGREAFTRAWDTKSGEQTDGPENDPGRARIHQPLSIAEVQARNEQNDGPHGGDDPGSAG